MIYSVNGESLNYAHKICGSNRDYSTAQTTLQQAILTARDAWMEQARKRGQVYSKNGTLNDTGYKPVVPYVLHTDQHNNLTTDQGLAISIFQYLGVALNWSEISACIGLGDVDLVKANYTKMNDVLSYVPRAKRIDIWGNHDLWNNSTTVDSQFVIDFDTVYPYFNNENYGDESHAYNHKGIEYHIDQARKIKYICIAGWEVDSALGGNSHYNITSDSMDGIIDALEMEDEYDIVILAHCSPVQHGHRYDIGEPTDSGDALYDQPVLVSEDAGVTSPVVVGVDIDGLIESRNAKTSGSVNDSYGNTHAYDFTQCNGNIVCILVGHGHQDRLGYSPNEGIPTIMYDAYAYETHPFYFANLDRSNGTVDGWKITSGGLVQAYSVPLDEADLPQAN